MWDRNPTSEEPHGFTPALLPSESQCIETPPTRQPVVIPNMEELRQQFQQQQAVITQIKEKLKESDADRASKEKQLEIYTKKLAQIKNRPKQRRDNGEGVLSASPKSSTRRRSEEIMVCQSTDVTDDTDNLPVKTKMSELKKQLEENKIKFEERTEKGLIDTKKVETIVQELRDKLEARDISIHALQKNMETPPARPRPKPQTLPKRHKEQPVIVSKWTQTQAQSAEKEANLRIKQLEAKIIDLEDTIKEQKSVLEARTQAISILSQDLNKKGQLAVDESDCTRASAVENQLKSELVTKENSLRELEEKLEILYKDNEKLREVNKKLVEEAQVSHALTIQLEKPKGENVELEKKVLELEKELEDSNKLMIRLKLEHKQKLKALAKKNQSQQVSGETSEKWTEIENLKITNSNLMEKLSELEEEKATHEKKITELMKTIEEKNLEWNAQLLTINKLETDQQGLLQTIEDQNIMIDNLNSRIECMEKDSTFLPQYEIPGDGAAQQFDKSNQNFQNQIDDLVREKMLLLDKLKGFHSIDSSTFETLPDQAPLNEKLSSELTAEKHDEEPEKQLTANQDPEQGKSLKDKFKRVAMAVKKEKARVADLIKLSKEKDEIISQLTEKINFIERKRSESTGSVEPEVDISDLQRKYLEMESDFLQLTEKYDHLRKENIELTGEKVRRLQSEEDTAKIGQFLQTLKDIANGLDERIVALEEATSAKNPELDYANIVIASKDTEIFNLQSTLATKIQELEAITERANREKAATEWEENEVFALKAENQGLTSKIKEKTKEIEKLSETLSKINTENEQLKQELLRENEKNIALQRIISERDEEISSKNQELWRLSEESKELNEKIFVLSGDCMRFKEECHRLQVSIESVMIELVQERARADDQQKKANAAGKEMEEALLKYEETEKVLQKTWDERNELIQMREAILLRLHEVENDAKNLLRERDEAQSQFNKIQASATLHQQQITDLDCELRKKSEELAGKEQEFEAMVVKVKKIAANLKKKTQIEKEMSEQISVLKAENTSLLNRLEKESSEKENENIKTLTSEIEQLKEDNDALLLEMQKMARQLEELDSEKHTQAELYQSKIDDYINQISAAQSENQSLPMKLESLQKEMDSLKIVLTDVEEKWTKEKSEKDELRGLNEKKNEELGNLQQLLELEQNENEKLMEKLSSTLKELQEVREQMEAMLGESEKHAAHLEELHEQIRNMDQTINSLEGDKLALKNENQALLESNKDANDYSKQIQDQLDQLLTAKTTLENLLQEKENLLELANHSISVLQNSLSVAEKEKNEVIQKFTNNETVFREKIEGYESEITQLQRQVSNFNIAFDAEVQKSACLKADVESYDRRVQDLEDELKKLKTKGEEEKIGKRKKSVTFNTEEADYIKELRGEVASLQKALVESDATVEQLKSLQIKEPAVTTFNADLFEQPSSGDFFSDSQQPSDPFLHDSLQWDDSWGTEGQLEIQHMSSKSNDPEKVTKLEMEVKTLYAEKEELQEEYRVLQVKYSKVVKKLKEQKTLIDQLEKDLKQALASRSSFGDLDAALLDEMKAELTKARCREEDVQKELNNMEKEKEDLLKQIEVLNAGNDRFLEMKERQDLEAASWQTRNLELKAQVAELEAQLQAPPDDNQLAIENRELKNLIDALEWKVCELTEMIEEKTEKIVDLENNQLTSTPDQNDRNEKLRDTEKQLAMLVEENEALQTILNEKKHDLPVMATTQVVEEAHLVQEIKQLKDELNLKNQQIEKISNDLLIACASADLEKAKLVEMLNAKEEELTHLRGNFNDINQAYAEAKLEIERLLAEEQFNSDSPSAEIEEREKEIEKLQQRVDELENAYSEAKLEIERLLSEESLNSNPIMEEQLLTAQRLLESERARHESMLRIRDSEISDLRQSLQKYEENHNKDQQTSDLKVKIRELEASAVRSSEEKDLELREVKAECEELRELLTSRQTEITRLEENLITLEKEINQKWQNSYDESYDRLRHDYEKTVEYLKEKTEQLSKVQPTMEQKDSDISALRQELRVAQQRLSVKDNEAAQRNSVLESELLVRDAEIRELRAECLELNTEIRELRQKEPPKVQVSSPTEELSVRLQSDLDSALYMLHQRDVRCDELTFELMQLLEERDTLQLRLSTAIRENEEMRRGKAEIKPGVSQNEENLAHKLSELHSIGYGRDKNIQDESQQRYRDQMALLNRHQNAEVFDV